MIRVAETGAALLQTAERRAKRKAAASARGAVLAAIAAALGFGVVVFASVGVLMLLAPSIGAGPAALAVALIWLPMAGLAAYLAVNEARKPEVPLVPENAAERMLDAARQDFGQNSPLIAVAALVAAAVASRRR